MAAALVAGGCGEGGSERERPAAAGPRTGSDAVAGRELFIRCAGRGRPLVVLGSGLGVPSANTWSGVMPRVARTTRRAATTAPGSA